MTNEDQSNSAAQQDFLSISSAASPRVAAGVGTSFEPELIALLMRPVPLGQAREGHATKEHEVGELFARLTVLEARALHQRLARKAEGDALVVAFDRLVVERRARLLAFLGDARRREALARCA